MKKAISIIAISFLVSLAVFGEDPVAKGNTHCCLGTYVINKATDPIMVGGIALNSFVVSYENSDLTVTIGIDNSDRKCTTYIVHSKGLTMQYDCNGKIFGVNKVKKKYRYEGLVTDPQVLNREEYFHQKVITQKEKSEIDHLRLISVFYPLLVIDYEKVFAVK